VILSKEGALRVGQKCAIRGVSSAQLEALQNNQFAAVRRLLLSSRHEQTKRVPAATPQKANGWRPLLAVVASTAVAATCDDVVVSRKSPT
jgi:anti-sigma-K factor RskA